MTATSCPPDPVMLGRILLLQNSLHAAPDEQRLAEMVIQGLTPLPGIGGIRFCLSTGVVASTMHDSGCDGTGHVEGEGDFWAPDNCPLAMAGAVVQVFPMTISGRCYGALFVNQPLPHHFEPYIPYVTGVSNLVALYLENRRTAGHLVTANQLLKRLAQKQSAKYRLLYEAMAEGVVYQDAEGRILSVNPAAERMLGFSMDRKDGVARKHIARAIREDGSEFPEEEHPSMKALQTGKAVQNITMGITHAGKCEDSCVWLSVNAIPLFRPGETAPYQVFTTLRDITERKRSDKALRERKRELRKANDELERFVYTASHDLKSPVITAQAFLKYLETDLAKGNMERLERDIFYLRTSLNRMEQLLSELLALSRVGRKQNPPEAVSFGRLAGEALNLVAGAIEQRGVEARMSGPAEMTLFGDRSRLVELWQNLLDNGVKFMGDQPVPLLELGAEGQGRETVFFVRDNGVGIEPRDREKVFNLFEKLDSSCAGSGLGLALVKRIVELNRGSIWVESEGKGRGSCFRFTLPAVFESADRAP